MKKIVSIIALVLAMTMLMSVSAFAAKEFALAETAVIPEGASVTPGADSIAVSVPATIGADYSILLVDGSTLPTAETAIAYINQDKAEGESVAFNVLPKLSCCGETCTIYVGSNATGFDLISVPVTYKETAPAGPVVTFMDGTATVATLTAVDGAVVAPAGPAVAPTPAADALIDRYEFVGWTDTAGTTTYKVGDSIPATAEMTLYAKYQMYDKTNTTKLMVWGDYTGDGKVLIPDMTQMVTYFKNKSACSKAAVVGKKLDVDHMTYVFGDIVISGTVLIPDMTQMVTYFKNKPSCTVADLIGTPIYFINK